MAIKYDLSDLPDIGALSIHSIDGKVSIFRTERGRVEVASSESVTIEEHRKKLSLIAAAPALLHALVSFVEEEETVMEHWKSLKDVKCREITEERELLKRAKIAIRSALGLKQTDATVQNIG